jgi:hypothetical protein
MNHSLAKNGDNQLVGLRITCVIIFAIAMGILEAICVVYIRQIIFPPHGIINDFPTDNFNFTYEIIRESITIIMLTTVALIAAYNWRTRLAMFFIAFGIWDIFYYIGLKIFLNWPASIMEWDTLFLIPIAWYSPVIVPVLISFYFIAGGIFIILHEGNGTKLRFTAKVVVLQASAFIIWIISFMINTLHIADHGYENVKYSWILFNIALILGLLSLRFSLLSKQGVKNI